MKLLAGLKDTLGGPATNEVCLHDSMGSSKTKFKFKKSYVFRVIYKLFVSQPKRNLIGAHKFVCKVEVLYGMQQHPTCVSHASGIVRKDRRPSLPTGQASLLSPTDTFHFECRYLIKKITSGIN